MIVTPNFHFKGNCQEAIALYQRAFGVRVICVLKNDDANPADFVADREHLKYVYHAEVMLGDTRLFMSDLTEGATGWSGNSLSLVVTFATAGEVKMAYNLLKEGAVTLVPVQKTTYSSCFVSLIDKYGMRWELMTEQTAR